MLVKSMVLAAMATAIGPVLGIALFVLKHSL